MPERQIILQAQPERFVQDCWPDAGSLLHHLCEQVRMRKGPPGERVAEGIPRPESVRPAGDLGSTPGRGRYAYKSACLSTRRDAIVRYPVRWNGPMPQEDLQ
jgi:hypothetical protein